MINGYYKLEIDYFIYFKISRKKVNITVPGYEVYNKECVVLVIDDYQCRFYYYEFVFDLIEKNGTKKISVFNRLNNFENKVTLYSSSVTEFTQVSIKIDRSRILKFPYKRHSSKIPQYKYLYNKSQGLKQMVDIDNRDGNDFDTFKNNLLWIMLHLKHASCDNCPMDGNAEYMLKNLHIFKNEFNCRNMAVILNAINLSFNLKSRYIICLQQEEKINNSHFMVEAFITILNKWIVVDSSYGLLFMNEKEEYMSLAEVRSSIALQNQITIKKILPVNKLNETLYFKSLTTKLYRFMRPLISDSSYDVKGKFVELVPRIDNMKYILNHIIIDNPLLFWGF